MTRRSSNKAFSNALPGETTEVGTSLERSVTVDLDPDRTDEEATNYAPVRRLALLRGGQIVEISGAPDRETR